MTELTYLELFAGVGGMSLAFDRAGFRCVGHAEIEPFPRRVLKHRWPDVPLFGDVCELRGGQVEQPTIVTFGAPCQDLSVAGKRVGLAGSRSSLFYEGIRLWNETQAPYALYENVLGALSSNKGGDFARVLSAFVGSPVNVPKDGWRGGGGVVAGRAGVAAWRVLDAQFFGVPQRRRRVFVLGARAGGVDPAEVLSLAEGLSRHPASSGEAREGTSETTGSGVETAGTCNGLKSWSVQTALDVTIQSRPAVFPLQNPQMVMRNQRGIGSGKDGDPMFTLESRGHGDAVAFAQNTRDEVRQISGDVVCALAAQPGMKQTNYVIQNPSVFDARGNGDGNVDTALPGDHLNRITDYTPVIAGTLASPHKDYNSLQSLSHMQVASGRPRRLTPLECERLMGWPDGWTDVPDEKGKPASDSVRYKACGNGVATPVANWIALRLRQAIEWVR